MFKRRSFFSGEGEPTAPWHHPLTLKQGLESEPSGPVPPEPNVLGVSERDWKEAERSVIEWRNGFDPGRFRECHGVGTIASLSRTFWGGNLGLHWIRSLNGPGKVQLLFTWSGSDGSDGQNGRDMQVPTGLGVLSFTKTT